MSDMSDWPRPSGDELPELYEETREMTERADGILRDYFQVDGSGSMDRIVFDDAGQDDFLRALNADHEVMVPLFQKVAGLPDREFERQYGVGGIGQRLKGRKSSFKGYEPAERFAEVLSNIMPDSLSLESIFYTFFKMRESDQRRFYRMRYEEDIREFLVESGYPNFKGNSLPEEPDFVIPESEPYEVIGEVRVIQRKDREKRFKEFRSEAAAAATNFPDARFVAIANMGAYIEHHDDRESLRDGITKDGSSEIDAVFFHDERDELLDQLSEWGVTRQTKIG
jgi:hypothetical protein